MNGSSRILIVDDSETSLNILERILNSCGYENIQKASGAWDGIELLDEAENSKEKLPDLILMDIVMPQMNGIEAVQRLKTHPIYEHIPIIMISVKNDAQTLSDAFEAGAADFILKPVSKPVLKARVDAIIKLKLETDKRKQQEEELKTLNRRLEDLNQVKNRFLGTAAHDLRGPLASIRGFAEMLADELDGKLNGDQAEMLSMIHETSHGMLSLVNDLLDYAVIESGRLSLLKQESELRKIIDRRININEPLAARKNITIKRELEDVGIVSVDKNRIDQVLDNLLGNAVKFSPQNTEVTVKLYKEGNSAALTVADQGVGISEEDIPKLFGEYCTVSSKPTDGEKSTGLGLFIIKSIVYAHHGSFSVKSKKGEGTEITVKLPAETSI
ncbi:MAG: hybrid sensor histidine kinase/response regulator [Geovibrio sp.]|nr:hybrid sensor histidine kinase/response regulator [Geovibrio sp.]